MPTLYATHLEPKQSLKANAEKGPKYFCDLICKIMNTGKYPKVILAKPKCSLEENQYKIGI